MQVTLISPYLEIYSIGLRTFSSILKRRGIPVRMLFLPQNFHCHFIEENLKEITNLVKDSDLIGISLMSNQLGRVIQLTKALKANTKAFIIWGGIHPSTCPEESLQHADGICIGEGEDAFTELAIALKDNQPTESIKGLWFNKNGTIIKNEIQPLTQNIDSFPYPDYAYKEQYLLDDGHIRLFNDNYFKKHFSTIYLTLTSRGCPYSCAYCCNDALKKIYHKEPKLYRRRSLNNVIEELLWVKKHIPFIERILFEDDLFLATSDENIAAFCNIYTDKINLPFTVAGITPSTINEKRLVQLLDAGMCYVRMGIQTASASTAKLFNRNFDIKKTYETIMLFNKYKNRIKAPYFDFILDTPWESIDDKIETLTFLASMPQPYKMNLFSMTFYPGTALYEKAKKEGYIENAENQIYYKNYTFLKHTCANALFYILYCNSYLPLSIKKLLLQKKVILFLDKYEILGKIIFLAAKGQYLCIEALKDIMSGKFWRIARFFEIRKKS